MNRAFTCLWCLAAILVSLSPGSSVEGMEVFPVLNASIVGDAVNAVQQQDEDETKAEKGVEIDPTVYAADANDDAMTALMKEKVRAALMDVEPKRIRVAQGRDPLVILLSAETRLIDALLEYHSEPAKQIELLQYKVQNARQIEAEQKMRVEAGVSLPDDLATATYFRADAELQLLRAQQDQ